MKEAIEDVPINTNSTIADDLVTIVNHPRTSEIAVRFRSDSRCTHIHLMGRLSGPLLSKISWDALEPFHESHGLQPHPRRNRTIQGSPGRSLLSGDPFAHVQPRGAGHVPRGSGTPPAHGERRRNSPPLTLPPMPWGTGTARYPMPRTTSHSTRGTSPPIAAKARPKHLGAKPLPISRALHRTASPLAKHIRTSPEIPCGSVSKSFAGTTSCVSWVPATPVC